MAIGGYDKNLRCHEGQLLAKQIHDMGYKVGFNPLFSAKHLEIDVRDNRQVDRKAAEDYLQSIFPHLKGQG